MSRPIHPVPGTTLAWTARDLDSRRREPVTVGIPWPPGALDDPSRLALRDGEGRRRRLQARALDRWPDRSVRWALLDFLLDTLDGGYRVEVGPSEPEERAGDDALRVETGSTGAVVIETAGARFRLEAGGRFPFAEVSWGGEERLDAASSGLFAEDEIENRYVLRTDTIELLEPGPVRAAVRLSGRLVSETADPLCEVGAEIHFHAGFAGVSLEIAVTNPRAAGHPRGRWSLGSWGSIYFGDLSLVLALPDAGDARRAAALSLECSPEVGSEMERYALPFSIYQDSSGGENWRSANHVNRHGEVALAFRGYRLRAGDSEERGLRAEPIVRLAGGEVGVAAAFDRFWQNFPRSIDADRRAVTLGLFPRHASDVQELQGGERKTHRLRLVVGPRSEDEAVLAWLREPLLVHTDPEWYASARAVPYLVPAASDPDPGCQRLIEAGLEGPSSFAAKREIVDEYGWRHFGDLYADHEAVHSDPDRPLVSHYNNQYDAVAGFAVQFLRSGDGRWFVLMDELARHVTDIDLYHTVHDKSAYNNGHFWHTVHYIDAGTSTHRSYPRSEGVGGGPSSGHLYTTGLMLHHLLTGCAASRRAVERLGRYVIDADDGSKTVFRFLDRGETGHISLSAFDGYHGPGRATANSLNALVDAHRLTGERAFLAKAERLVRRSIHPEDDLASRNLADVEGRWFYTMFLAALGRYLDHKACLGENDAMYAYGQASLLHYAAWAAEHEYPYLEKPEILEFPTETWAAQDMRKSEILRLAARHAEGELRRRFVERARWFFDVSVRQLEEHPTRAFCRPLVLLSTLGYGQAFSDLHPEDRAPRAVASWRQLGPPLAFVPQKERARRRFVWLSAAGLLGLGALALLGWIL